MSSKSRVHQFPRSILLDDGYYLELKIEERDPDSDLEIAAHWELRRLLSEDVLGYVDFVSYADHSIEEWMVVIKRPHAAAHGGVQTIGTHWCAFKELTGQKALNSIQDRFRKYDIMES